MAELQLATETTDPSAPRPQPTAASPYAPLRRPLFRWLWIASLVSYIGTWIQNVGAAWLMTDLSASSLMVSLVQAAANLPFFVLVLPAGALADILDRRRLLIVAEVWMLFIAVVLAVVTFSGHITPWTLLTLTFLLGVGAALNAPAWEAVSPELVPREEVPAAVALDGMALNAGRAVGPALGGLVVATMGVAASFLVNALSFVGLLVVLLLWRRRSEPSVLPAERLIGAMRVGLRYVRHDPALRTVVVRTLLFVVGGSGLWALLPVVARADPARGPAQYGLMLGCFGVGAVLGATVLSGPLRKLGLENMVISSTVVFAVALLVLAWLPFLGLWCAVLLAAGAAWLTVLSNLNASAIAVVPAWVRARALAVYLLGFFGSMAAGSLLWGEVADHLGAPLSLTLAAAWMLVGVLAAARLRLPTTEGIDLEPSRHWPELLLNPATDLEGGPMLVTVEYRVDPNRCEAFVEAMRPMRQARLRSGALRWDLFRDVADPGRFVEVFLTESVVEHLRQHERVSEADRQIEARVGAFHRGDGPPIVTHLVGGFHQPNGACHGAESHESKLEPAGPIAARREK